MKERNVLKNEDYPMVTGGQGTRAFRRNNFGREPVIRDNHKSESNSSHN